MALPRRRLIPVKRTPAQQAALKKNATSSKMPPASKGRLDTRPNSQKMTVTPVSPRKGVNQKATPTKKPLPRRRVVPLKRTKEQQEAYDKSQGRGVLPPGVTASKPGDPNYRDRSGLTYNKDIGDPGGGININKDLIDIGKDNISYAPTKKPPPRRRVIPVNRGMPYDDLDKLKSDADAEAIALEKKYGNVSVGPNGEMVRGPIGSDTGSQSPSFQTDGRFGGAEYATGLNPNFTGLSTQAMIPGSYMGRSGFFTDGSRNTFVADALSDINSSYEDLESRLGFEEITDDQMTKYNEAMAKYNSQRDRSREIANQRMIDQGGSFGPNGMPINFNPGDRYNYEESLVNDNDIPDDYVFSNISLDPRVTRPINPYDQRQADIFNRSFQSELTTNNLTEELRMMDMQIQDLMYDVEADPSNAEERDSQIMAMMTQMQDLQQQLERQSEIRNSLNEYIKNSIFGNSSNTSGSGFVNNALSSLTNIF
jgi:hypothetical protein